MFIDVLLLAFIDVILAPGGSSVKTTVRTPAFIHAKHPPQSGFVLTGNPEVMNMP